MPVPYLFRDFIFWISNSLALVSFLLYQCAGLMDNACARVTNSIFSTSQLSLWNLPFSLCDNNEKFWYHSAVKILYTKLTCLIIRLLFIYLIFDEARLSMIVSVLLHTHVFLSFSSIGRSSAWYFKLKFSLRLIPISTWGDEFVFQTMIWSIFSSFHQSNLQPRGR